MLTFKTDITADQLRMSQYKEHHNGFNMFETQSLSIGKKKAQLSFLIFSWTYGWRLGIYTVSDTRCKKYNLNTSCVTRLWL